MKPSTRFACFAALLGVFLALPLPAEPRGSINVDYLVGRAELRVGESWREIAIGEMLPATALVRTEKGSILQVSGQGKRLSISTAGNWDLSALMDKSKPQSGTQTLERLGEALRGIRARNSTAMGIRSAEGDSIRLMSGRYAEAEEALERATAAYLAEDLETAGDELSIAEEIYSWTDGEEPALASRIAFWNAALLASQARSGQALAALESQDWRLSGELAGQYLIMQAQLALESLAPERARALCLQALESDDSPALPVEETEVLEHLLSEAEAALQE